jgi:hypothetical protein
MTKIDLPIVGYSVVKKDEVKPEVIAPEKVKRPEVLTGSTYKIASTPLSEHALYVTINDRVLDGQRIPFEVFINSKDLKSFQWVVALTRVMSAVFRKGGEVAFLIEELKSVFDPSGGAFIRGRYVPSLVAQIGEVIEQHLIDIGLHTKDDSLQVAAVEMMTEKLEKKNANPNGAVLCDKCNEVSMILMDGCATCLSCGNSKCG